MVMLKLMKATLQYCEILLNITRSILWAIIVWYFLIFPFSYHLNWGEADTFFTMNSRRRKYATLVLVDCVMYSQRMHLWKKKSKKMLVKHSKLSVFYDILQELCRHDPEYFRRYLRMDVKVYDVGSSLKQILFLLVGLPKVSQSCNNFSTLFCWI